MNPVILASKDPGTIAKYRKLSDQLGRPLVTRSDLNGELPDSAVLVDCDSLPAGPIERAQLVTVLCDHARKAPTACFGYQLSDRQRARLERAGVFVVRGPGRILLRVLAMWEAFRGVEVQPEAKPAG